VKDKSNSSSAVNHFCADELRELAEKIKQWGRELGFQQVGITDTQLGEHTEHLRRWLDKDLHGEMDYMADREALRADPTALHENTLRVISLRMDYLPPNVETVKLLDHPKTAYLSRYALGRDYHKLIRKRIKKLADTIIEHTGERSQRPFVDSAPVLERAFAEKAGLGWIGKNTMLINSSMGSWFFLGELFTDLPLPIDPPQTTKHCGSCTACLDICPTNAFNGPFELDARKCISYLTIELKGSIPEPLRGLIGNRVFGCDDCQLICPWNKFAKPTDEKDFSPRHGLDHASMVDLFLWTEEEFEEKTQGSPIRRIGYQRWLRNLAVGIGNGENSPHAINALKSKLKQSPLVDEHIQWALEQLATNR
jgi:epoxyqueuosine reductase